MLWKVNSGSSIEYAPVVDAAGLIYVGCVMDLLVMKDDGSTLCRIKLPEGASRGLALDPDGTVYASAYGGDVYAVKLY